MPGFTPTIYAIPEGGDVVAWCSAESCMDPAGKLALIDQSTGTPVPGEVVRNEGTAQGKLFVFRPATPLAEGMRIGATYQTADLSEWLQDYEVQRTQAESVPSSQPSLQITENVVPTGQAFCCTQRLCDECVPPCITEREAVRAQVSLGLPEATAADSQWLYQATFSGEGGAAIVSDYFPWQGSAQAIFDVQSARYCYSLWAESVQDGQRVLVAEECVSSDVRVAQRDVTEDAKRELLLGCPQPIAGFEAEWCESFQHECASSSPPSERVCNSIRHTCQDDAGAGSTPPDAGADTEVHQGDHSLCSAGHGRTSHLMWLMALLVSLTRCMRLERPRKARP
ncbi:MAG: hypothetical protein QM778_19880 [Myxococcales bacterium]